MTRLMSCLCSSIGSKYGVAVSGLAMAGFVVFHMLGNLQVFEGREALNTYAAFLRDMPILLWAARLGLLGLFTLHIGLAIRLALHNRRARPVPYVERAYRRASLASRTMAVTGALVLLFILFHLLHLTAGLVDASYAERLDASGHRDVYARVLHAFRQPFFVVVYLAAQAVLGFHLSHAVSSSLQTLGLAHPTLNGLFKATGPAVAVSVVLGNTAIVLAVFLGMVRP